jgi:hypothetical protein
VNENQIDALQALRDARRPLKIHHSTGRWLADAGFVTRRKNGLWAITDAGLEELAERERLERRMSIDGSLTHDQRKYRQRIEGWLEVHANLTIGGRGHARHIAAALLTGVPVVEGGFAWGEDGEAHLRGWVEAAIDGLEEMREAKRKAKATGGNLVVSYVAGPRVEKRSLDRRRAAVESAVVEQPADGNIVGIEEFRQKRLA